MLRVAHLFNGFSRHVSRQSIVTSWGTTNCQTNRLEVCFRQLEPDWVLPTFGGHFGLFAFRTWIVTGGKMLLAPKQEHTKKKNRATEVVLQKAAACEPQRHVSGTHV